jgi:hypothetical protein
VGITLARPEMRNCSCVPSIHHASWTCGFEMICEILGVRMSVVVIRRGSEGVEVGERKARKMCERTWGMGVVGSMDASWRTV